MQCAKNLSIVINIMGQGKKQENIEPFIGNTNMRDTCYFACSSFSYINVILIIVAMLLLYHLIVKYFAIE